MKRLKRTLLAISALLCIVSCDNPDLYYPYGQTYVYMPQANRNPGVDNNFNVEISRAASLADQETHTVVILGAYRSGLAPLESFDVGLYVDADTLSRAVMHAAEPDASPQYAIYVDGVLLDNRYYSPLPDMLHIADNSRDATTHLVLNDAMLTADYPVGKSLFLPVRLKEPSKYILNEALSMTMVVVNIVE